MGKAPLILNFGNRSAPFAVGKDARYPLNKEVVGCWAPEPVKMFLFKTCRPSVGPTLPTQSTQHSTPWIAGALSLRVKQPECEVDYSHLCRELL